MSKKTLLRNQMLKFGVCSFGADKLDKDEKIKLWLELAAVCVHSVWPNFDFY